MVKISFDKNSKKSVAVLDNDIIGFCEYIENGNYWNIIHTFVDSKYQGQGIARKLVECVIKEAIDNNKNLIADCSYAKKIIEE